VRKAIADWQRLLPARVESLSEQTMTAIEQKAIMFSR